MNIGKPIRVIENEPRPIPVEPMKVPAPAIKVPEKVAVHVRLGGRN